MKKSLTLVAVLTFVAVQAFAATYVVILKNGTQYKAKEKWTVVNGKAIVKLENGQTLQFDPALIDVAKSEQATRMGLDNASVLDLDPNMPKNAAQKGPTLGTAIKLRPKGEEPHQTGKNAPPPPVAYTPPAGSKTSQVLDKFQRAYENDGIFETKVTATSERNLRVELTIDTEDRVFGAISTTAAMIVRNGFVEGAQIDGVELFMQTTNGGAAGRFQMSRADAEALIGNKIKREEYFITKVIY
ncbi:MAG TPA: hypothetical protein VGQ76_15840 [Thermoanaerobaculia bacterium]|jgi:hypothetical protein|nr:hypothetical protein [Thermoanaerobaculia bacterium]